MCISGVRSCYDEGKRDFDVWLYNRQHGIGGTLSRLAMNYDKYVV